MLFFLFFICQWTDKWTFYLSKNKIMHFQICGNNDGNIIHVFKNCISIYVATVLEVSKMTEPICTSHWCLVMSFWLIYSHTRGVKLGLGLGFMQTSQVLPHWLNQSFSFWTLPYTQRHCHVRIEKGPGKLLL